MELPGGTDGPQKSNLKIHLSIWIILAVAGLVSFFTLYDTAFPTASLDLKLTRDEVTAGAVDFARFVSYGEKDRVVATTFGSDSEARVFLDYKLGGKRANELMRGEIPVWRWITRICKPFNPEEAYIYTWPDGRIQGFTHFIPKEKKVPSLSADDAKAMVIAYARENTRLDVKDWKLIKEKEERKANRTDYIFEFEDQSRDFEDAKIRAVFEVYGNYVGRFREYLHVPEDFTRHYNEIRSLNRLLNTIARALGLVFDIGAVCVFFWAVKHKIIDARFFVRVSRVSAVVVFLFLTNRYWDLIYSYDTSEGFFEYILNNLSLQLWMVVFLGAYFALLFSGADALYRKWAPEEMSIKEFFTKKGLRAKPTVVGLTLAFLYLAFSLGYQCVFYAVGRDYGVWCPISVRDESVLGVLFPAFDAMFAGYAASIMEEMVYRVVGIIFLTRVFKNVWVANFIQAILWGFAHSSYPQQPAYIRGLELTIEGFISGAFFIKFGILPSLISHYLFNVTVSSTPSFCADNILSKLGALVPYMPPALWACLMASSIKKDGVLALAGSGLQNKDIVVEPIKEPVPVKVDFDPDVRKFNYKSLLIVIPIAILCLVSAWLLDSKSKVLGSEPDQRLTREEIIRKSKSYLQDAGIKLDGYDVSIWSSMPIYYKKSQLQYLLENAGFEKTNRYAKDFAPTSGWKARWYKPKVPQEYNVAMNDQGELMVIRIKHHENDQGASLNKVEAKQKAKAFLRKYHPEMKGFQFSSIRSEARKNRTDYTVIFDIPEYKVASAPFKIEIELIGDKVGGFDFDWHVPDQWEMDFKKKNLWQVLFGIYRNYFLIIAGILVMVMYTNLLVKQGISRKFMLGVSFLAVGFTLAANFNNWPQIFPYYTTDTPMDSYVVSKIFGGLFSLAFTGILFALLSSYSYCCLKELLGEDWKSYFTRMIPKRFANQHYRWPKSLWLDALERLFFAGLLMGSIGFLYTTARNSLFKSVLFHTAPPYSLFEVYSPALSELEGSLSVTLGVLLALPVVIFLYKRVVRNFKNYFILVLCLVPMFFADPHYPVDGLVVAIDFVVAAIAFYFMADRVIGKNYLTYVLGIFLIMIWRMVFVLYEHVYPNLSIDLYILIGIGIIPILVAIDDYFYKGKDNQTGNTLSSMRK